MNKYGYLFIALTMLLSACSQQANDFVRGATPRSRTTTDEAKAPRGVRFSGGQAASSSANLSMTVNTGQSVLRTVGGGGTLSATVGISRSPTVQ